MRNARFLVVAAVSLFVLPLDSAGEEEWKSTEAKQDTSYSTVYTWDACEVKVLQDGNGVELYVETTHSGKIFYHTIYIRRDETGVSCSHRRATYSDKEGLSTPGDGYDAFREKCGEAVKLLPKEVKALFFGKYLMEEES